MAQAPGTAENGGTYSQQFVQPVVIWYSPKPQYPPSWVLCSCVTYQKWYFNRLGEVWGAASRMQPNTTDLSAAELVLTTEGPGHVLRKVSVKDGYILTDEANFLSCKQSSRLLPIDSPSIRGLIDLDV